MSNLPDDTLQAALASLKESQQVLAVLRRQQAACNEQLARNKEVLRTQRAALREIKRRLRALQNQNGSPTAS